MDYIHFHRFPPTVGSSAVDSGLVPESYYEQFDADGGRCIFTLPKNGSLSTNATTHEGITNNFDGTYDITSSRNDFDEQSVVDESVLKEDIFEFLESYSPWPQPQPPEEDVIGDLSFTESSCETSPNFPASMSPESTQSGTESTLSSQWKRLSPVPFMKLASPGRHTLGKLPEATTRRCKNYVNQVETLPQEALYESHFEYSREVSPRYNRRKDSFATRVGPVKTREERIRLANRMSAHRYRSKRKTLSEETQRELSDTVAQYRKARLAYEKVASSYDELARLVVKIMESR